jgi:hypothetical protein
LNNTALIFGAGKTGRGLAAQIAFLGGYDNVLIDKNWQLIEGLKKANQYDIQVLDNKEKNCTINLSGAYHIDDVLWHDEFIETSVAFTAVFGNNLEELATRLATALQRWYAENPKQIQKDLKIRYE